MSWSKTLACWSIILEVENPGQCCNMLVKMCRPEILGILCITRTILMQSSTRNLKDSNVIWDFSCMTSVEDNYLSKCHSKPSSAYVCGDSGFFRFSTVSADFLSRNWWKSCTTFVNGMVDGLCNFDMFKVARAVWGISSACSFLNRCFYFLFILCCNGPTENNVTNLFEQMSSFRARRGVQ